MISFARLMGAAVAFALLTTLAARAQTATNSPSIVPDRGFDPSAGSGSFGLLDRLYAPGAGRWLFTDSVACSRTREIGHAATGVAAESTDSSGCGLSGEARFGLTPRLQIGASLGWSYSAGETTTLAHNSTEPLWSSGAAAPALIVQYRWLAQGDPLYQQIPLIIDFRSTFGAGLESWLGDVSTQKIGQIHIQGVGAPTWRGEILFGRPFDASLLSEQAIIGLNCVGAETFTTRTATSSAPTYVPSHCGAVTEIFVARRLDASRAIGVGATASLPYTFAQDTPSAPQAKSAAATAFDFAPYVNFKTSLTPQCVLTAQASRTWSRVKFAYPGAPASDTVATGRGTTLSLTLQYAM